MEARQRRSFRDDDKRQAVDLVASSGRSIGSIAKELGLRVASWAGRTTRQRLPVAAKERATAHGRDVLKKVQGCCAD
jgi:transposase